MSRVREVTPKVREILEDFYETRSSDRLLIMKVYSRFYHVPHSTPFVDVILRDDLPSFESIRRARQRLQAEDVDLRACDEVDAYRRLEEEDYRAFARGE